MDGARKTVCHEVPETSLRTGSFLFLLAFVWHIKLLPLFHQSVGREVLAQIALHPENIEVFREAVHYEDNSMSREFAFIGSITHTVVFILGLVWATSLTRIIESRFSGKPGCILFVKLVLVILTASGFHKVAEKALQYCFESRYVVSRDLLCGCTL